MLDEIESLQAQLFEKRKFVLSNFYLVPISGVPRELWPEVLENSQQIERWRDEFALKGRIEEPTLDSHPSLVVDTALMGPDFQKRLLASLDDIDGSTDGLLVNSENFAAVRTLLPLCGSRAKLVYIDPPYNTGGDGFLYKDEFSRHSAWLGLMDSRLRLGRALLSPDGSLFVSVDDNEHSNLKQLGDEVFGAENHLTSMVWEGGLKNDSRYISVGHDYIVGWLRDAGHVAQTGERWRIRKEGIDDIYAEVERLKAKHGSDFARISAGLKEWYRGIKKSDPAFAHRHFDRVDQRGVYHPDNIAWPGGGGPHYEVLHPVTGEPVKRPRTGWRYSTPERMTEMIEDDRIHFDADHTTVPKVKRYLHELEGQVLPSVFYRDRRAAMKELGQVLGGDEFSNPKDVLTLQKLVEASTTELSLVVDYFAGSGSTAHAVMALNRELGGSRRFLLVEMGEYFETVLLRRLRKVMYAPEWKDGAPDPQPSVTGDPPEWVQRSPRLVEVLSLESYEDSLNSLTVAGAAAELGADQRIRYSLAGSVEDSHTFLATSQLEGPFAYQLEVHTDEGVEYKDVDLVATFNLIKGIRPKRYRELSSQGRRYVVIEGIDGGDKILVVWRSVKDLDPEAERAFLETEIPAALDTQLGDYAKIWHNADSALPNSESLDAEFKRLMFEPEPVLA